MTSLLWRCRHEHVLYPTPLVERFGESTPVIEVRQFLLLS